MPIASDAVEALIEQARQRFHEAEEAEAEIRARQQEDLEFLDVERQWPTEIRQERYADRRPCLSVDRLMPFVRQVLNQMRAVRPRIGVAPRDSQSDPETAQVLQEIIRYIEDRSRAAVAYQTAAFHQVAIGRGYLRVVSEYASPDSFDQELRIARVRNPFAVYLDPYATELDGRDARYAFVIGTLSKDAFRSRYGEAALDRVVSFQPTRTREWSWVTEQGIRVAEYWYLDEAEDELWRLEPDPSLPPELAERIPEPFRRGAVLASTLPPDPLTGAPMVPPGLRKTAWRKTTRTVVRWAIISGTDLLVGDETGTQGEIWPTRVLPRIPIVPVIGEEIDYGGRTDVRGLVRHGRDIQKLYNFHVSALAEEIALKPKAPYIGYEGQFAGLEKKWQQANRRSFPYLEVRPLTIEGQLAPLPQRQIAEPAIQAIVVGLRQADYDMKSVMGLYEPSLGERRGSSSGRAILALQRQGEIGVGHFPDNLATALRALGEIIVDVIPQIYGPSRVLRLLGEDRRERTIQIGRPTDEKQPGVEGIYDLGSGRYDVIVTVGPSQETRRQEVAQQLAQFVQAYPAAFPLLGDLLVGSLDWEGASEAARRLKAMLPPQLAALGEKARQLPPEVVAYIAALERQIAELQQAADPQRVKAEAIRSRERIAALKAQTALTTEELRHAARASGPPPQEGGALPPAAESDAG